MGTHLSPFCHVSMAKQICHIVYVLFRQGQQSWQSVNKFLKYNFLKKDVFSDTSLPIETTAWYVRKLNFLEIKQYAN